MIRMTGVFLDCLSLVTQTTALAQTQGTIQTIAGNWFAILFR